MYRTTFIIGILIFFLISGVRAQTPDIVIQDGHNADITSIAVHPFKKQITTYDSSGKLVVWDMNTRMILNKIEAGQTVNRNNEFGLLKYTGGGNGIVVNSHWVTGYKWQSTQTLTKTLDLKTGETIFQDGREIDFGFSADSSQLLTVNQYYGYEDQPVFAKSWLYKQPKDSTQLGLQLSFEQKITHFKVVPPKNIVLVGFFDGTVKAVDIETFSTVWEEKDYGGPITSFDFSPDGEWASITGLEKTADRYGDQYIMVRQVADGSLIKKIVNIPAANDFESYGFNKAQFSPDGHYLASVRGFKLKIWETDNFRLIYDDQPADNFSAFSTLGYISDFTFLNQTDELVLASGSQLFSFNVAAKTYSNLLGSGMTQNYAFNDIGLLNERQYFIFDEYNDTLETIDLSNFDNQMYGPIFWSALAEKAGVIDTTLQSISLFSDMVARNPVTFLPDQNRIILHGYKEANNKQERHDYFLSFDHRDWSFQEAYGPLQWDDTLTQTYPKLLHIDSDNRWYIMKGYSPGAVTGVGSLLQNISLVDMETHQPQINTTILAQPGITISPSGKYIAWTDTTLHMKVLDTQTLEELYRMPIHASTANIAPAFTPEGALFVANMDSTATTRIKKVQLDPLREELYWELNNPISSMAVSDDHMALGLNYDFALDKWQDSVQYKLDQYGIEHFIDPNVVVVDRRNEDKAIITKITGLEQPAAEMALRNNTLLLKPHLQPVQIHSLANDGYGVKHLKFDRYNVFSDGYYYTAPKEALGAIGVQINDRIFPVQNFDMLYNRPDVLMENLGLAPDSRVDLYHQAYQKRLATAQMTSDTSRVFEISNFPKLEVLNGNEILSATSDSIITVKLKALDENHGLASWNINVNGVPLFGAEGKDITAAPGDSVKLTGRIPLSAGENKIKILAENKAGIQSVPVQRIVQKETRQQLKPDVYVVTIGVSDYRQDEYDLQYAAKDAADLQNLFNPVDSLSFGTFQKFNFPQNYYGDIHQIMLTDGGVDRDAIKTLKDKLMQSNPDDMVLVFLAGHGMLDKEGTYYFAGHDMDFQNPAANGISFEDIQGIFDAIPARKRVLFMDTCQSGELDSTNPDFTAGRDSSAVHTYGDTRIVSNLQRGVKTLSAGSKLAQQDEFSLMKELFADFNSSGTVIISAASGTGYALENDTWKNGVFTYAVIQGLGEYKADSDKNRRITVSELKQYVLKEVEVLTEGRQTPTTRQENVGYDFRVW